VEPLFSSPPNELCGMNEWFNERERERERRPPFIALRSRGYSTSSHYKETLSTGEEVE